MICHVTYLEVSEDYTSQHDLESSEAQHITLKTYREEKVNSDQVDYRREVLSEGSCMHSIEKQ